MDRGGCALPGARVSGRGTSPARGRGGALAAALAAALAMAAAGGAPAESAEDRLAIIEATNALDASVDAKDWQRARAVFAEEIAVSLPGQETRMMPSAELVGLWEENLYDEKASFHLRGGHLVSFDGPDRATVASKGYAWNRVEGLAGGDLWEVWGDYVYEAKRTPDGWRLTSFSFAPAHQRGNTDVPGYRPAE